MGQNNSRDQWSSYDSQEFFKQQIHFYRWRADSISNTHICKVFFKLQETVRDRQKLKIFLNTKFTQNECIPLSELMNLSNGSDKHAKEELMSFQTYIGQLSDLEASMPLPEVLYTLKVMFSGYQLLLNKLGKCRVDLNCCFVTSEGEVRVWINRDYKNNQLQLDSNSLVGKNSVISSQMAVIRRCIEIAETLASNHTQFLHFSRQFRSYMQRDMLQNWNFQNARKLINSYVYTYRINIPSNIKNLIAKYIQISRQSPLNSSRFQSQTQISMSNSEKDQLASTGEMFVKQKSHSNQSSKKELGRPLSYSDYSNSKKSENIAHNTIKSHSKKFSSTDLKCQMDKNKSFESPKISRSDLIPFKRKDENIKQTLHFQSPSIQTLKLRKQREYAIAENRNESKLYNFSTSVGFSPNMNNSTIQFQNKDFSTQRLNNSNSILKKTQQTKEKKKLQKKVATISKYISYYQNQTENRAEQNTYRQVIEQQPINKSSSNGGYIKTVQQRRHEEGVKQNIISPSSNSKELYNHSTNNSQNNFKKQFPTPYYQKSVIDQNRQKHLRGKNQKNENNKSIYSSNESQDNAISNQPCFTIKTVNKLLQNNEVSLHESNGSFMSIEQSDSSYQGVLNKMGRSVDVLNLPSNKQVTIQKKAFFANSMNRSQLLK